MTRLFYFLMALGLVLVCLTLDVAGRQLIAVGNQAVVDYRASENTITLSPSIDFANVRVTFTDLPGQYVTVQELRGWVKSRVPVKP